MDIQHIKITEIQAEYLFKIYLHQYGTYNREEIFDQLVDLKLADRRECFDCDYYYHPERVYYSISELGKLVIIRDCMSKIKKIPIEDLELTIRSERGLRSQSINTIGDLLEKTPKEIKNIKNLGPKSWKMDFQDFIIGTLKLQLKKDSRKRII